MDNFVDRPVGGDREQNGEQTHDSNFHRFTASLACLQAECCNDQRIYYHLLPAKAYDVPASPI